ncbi:KGGVGR-motif variant AAA ATPase [Streptomyces sp. NPDC014733]|uniref:KGGVGR-motif variant AAA ATPase n=1 Tax=Streptomyces sp. NPDC014733 TaxID=3364885 RepID=UPI0036F7C2EB
MEPFGGEEPGNLYTWVDVDERLGALAEAGEWPGWLFQADAWWDGLELTASPETDEGAVRGWLDTVFGAGSVAGDPGEPHLMLDRPQGLTPESLPISLIFQEAPSPHRRELRLLERHVDAGLGRFLPRPIADVCAGGVQLFAFHSFKGGSGRTVHAVGLADELARRGRRVLLVDGDLEAPGITWMHQAQGGVSDIGYEDFLALLHGSPGDDVSHAVAVAERYLTSQEVLRHQNGGSVTILPAGRRSRLGPPRIEPTHLATADRSPYFLTDSLAQLAEAAGLDAVIIDLRAGASELSAPVLLDPRVQRVFVTTLSSQSLEGTERMLRQLGNKAPAMAGEDPVPAVVITQYRTDAHSAKAESARAQLAAQIEGFTARPAMGDDAPDTAEVDARVLTAPLLSRFREELLALPRTWDDVIEVVRRCGVGELVGALVPEVVAQPDAVEPLGVGIEERRTGLMERARSLVFAEKTGLDSGLGFLSTEPLRRLAGDHRTSLPITVVVGAKGAGKTFTYARMCAAGRWAEFAGGAGEPVGVDAPVVPVLDPGNMDQYGTETSRGPQDLRDGSAGGEGARPDDIHRLLNDALHGDACEDGDHWRQVWLRCMAVAADGPGVMDDDPEAVLLERGRRSPVLFVFDGLEDFFQDIDSDAKRVALRTLFTEVPDWLRMLRGRPLGAVIFVRRDLVRAAVRQNLGQFLDRYEPYALHWDAQEALRLALWVAVTSHAVPSPTDELTTLSWERIAQELTPVWGAKLGRDNSREAWSERWVPAALADYNEQVQARDVVRFLRDAAERSRRDGDWPDRLLVPSALRAALVACSKEKLQELGQENPSLGELLRSVGGFADEVVMPFDAEDVGLDANGISVLEEAGALQRDVDGRYRLPEIYRHALGFRTRGRARVVRS